MSSESLEKRVKAEVLILQAERELKTVALDFGMQFARTHRQQIGDLCRELRDRLQASDECGIEAGYASLQEALIQLNQEVRPFYGEDPFGEDYFNGEN
jgi:molecular chaperone DnaK